MIDPSVAPSLRADVLWFASLLDLAAGKVDASRRTTAEARGAEGAATPEHRRAGFGPVTEWHAATLPMMYDDSSLEGVRARARSMQIPRSGSSFVSHDTRLGTTVQVDPLRYYTVGMIALRLGDTAEAVGSSAKLANLAKASEATGLTRDLDRGLRAQLAWSRRDARGALVLLEALENNDNQGDVSATPFISRANERYLRGEILEALGRHEEALKWFGSLGEGSVSEIPLRALSHYRQAEVFERTGRTEQARRHYARFAKLWADADVRFQPMVRQAREKAADR